MKSREALMIKEIGKLATKQAIKDYKSGNIAPDVFEQIGRVLHWMQKETTQKKKDKKL